MYCRTLGCLFTAIPASDCPADGYVAVKVDRAGNMTEIGHYDKMEAAEEAAAVERELLLLANSQFGVGA